MFCITKTEDEVGAIKLLTVPRREFCCGSMLLVFGVRVTVRFHLTFVHLLEKSCSLG